jgi:hypothetical protein
MCATRNQQLGSISSRFTLHWGRHRIHEANCLAWLTREPSVSDPSRYTNELERNRRPKRLGSKQRKTNKGGAKRQSALIQLGRYKSIVIVAGQTKKRNILRMSSLNQHLARTISATCPARYLGQLLIEALCSSEINAVEPAIRIQNTDQGYGRKIVPLGDQLSAHQNINRPLTDSGQIGSKISCITRVVTIKAQNPHPWQHLLQGIFDPLRSFPDRVQRRLAAFWALLGQIPRNPTMMAAQPFAAPVEREMNITAIASRLPPAGRTEYNRCKSPTIHVNDALLATVQPEPQCSEHRRRYPGCCG